MEVCLCTKSIVQQMSSSEISSMMLCLFFPDCPQPPQPENGGYKCHPSPCNNPLTSGSVIEYLCVEGYMLKGDYKYLTCKNGEWNPAMEVSCRLSPGEYSPTPVGHSELPVHWLFRLSLNTESVWGWGSPYSCLSLLQQFHKYNLQTQLFTRNVSSVTAHQMQAQSPSYKETTHGKEYKGGNLLLM